MKSNLKLGSNVHVFGFPAQNYKKEYKYWELRILLSLIIGYASFYLVRQNFSMAIPKMVLEWNCTKADIGYIISWGSIIYGVGKGVCGFITDKVSPRWFMSFGLLMSAIVSFSIGLSSGLTSLFVLFCLSNLFQSMGVGPCIRLLAHWFSPKELATKWSIWNMSQQIGGALTVVIAGFAIRNFGWQYAFFIPGILSIIGAIYITNRLRDTPESLGLPSIEHYNGLNNEHNLVPYSTLTIIKQVLGNRLVWCMACANFFVYFVRMAIFFWGPTFLSESKGSTLNMAGWQTATYDIAGMVGGVIAGYLSDKVFHGYRGRVGAIYMIILSICILLLWQAPSGFALLHFLAMACIGFLVVGPQILVGVAAADFASKRAAAAANGLTGFVGYLGTAFAGSIGKLVDCFGWDAALIAMACAAALSAIFFMMVWNNRAQALEGEEEN